MPSKPGNFNPNAELNKASRALLNSKAWKKFRARFLSKPENAFCIECKAQGLLVATDEVDHIVPRAAGGAVFDEANCSPLCTMHHSIKTKREMTTIKKKD